MKEEIDYNSKILNFLAMTDINDQELAVKYLEENDWDESKAANKFLNEINENQNNNNIINENIDQNIIFNDSNRSTNELFNENRLENNLELNNNNQNENIFYKYCIKLPYQFILNCCSENRAVSKEDERKLFQLLPNLMDDFVEYCHLIKRKIGIIIFYDGNCINFLKIYIPFWITQKMEIKSKI